MSIDATIWGVSGARVLPPLVMYNSTRGKSLASNVAYLLLSTSNKKGEPAGEIEIVLTGPTGRQRAEKIAAIINADDKEFSHE